MYEKLKRISRTRSNATPFSLLPAIVVLGTLPAVSGEEGSQTARTPRMIWRDVRQWRLCPSATGFDFYVLSSSWSPTWVRRQRSERQGLDRRNRPRTWPDRNGLWPQNEGSYRNIADAALGSRARIARTAIFRLIPSMGLIGHQCASTAPVHGLSQRDYFAVTRAAHGGSHIPRIDGCGRRENSPSGDRSGLQEEEFRMTSASIALPAKEGYSRNQDLLRPRN